MIPSAKREASTLVFFCPQPQAVCMCCLQNLFLSTAPFSSDFDICRSISFASAVSLPGLNLIVFSPPFRIPLFSSIGLGRSLLWSACLVLRSSEEEVFVFPSFPPFFPGSLVLAPGLYRRLFCVLFPPPRYPVESTQGSPLQARAYAPLCGLFLVPLCPVFLVFL